MGQGKESRQDRLDRLKGSFAMLSKVRKVIEFVRYERAANGTIAMHPGVPKEYYEDHRDALWQLLVADCDNDENRAKKFAELARKRPSDPFVKP